MWLTALKSVPHLVYRGWAKVLPSPVIDEAGWMAALVLLDEPVGVGVVVVLVLLDEQATPTIPVIAATITNNLARLTSLLLLLGANLAQSSWHTSGSTLPTVG